VVVLVIVVVSVRGRRDDLAARVEATHGTDPVWTARAVALRTRVHRGRADLVLRTALGRATVRLLFLGDRHSRGEGYQPTGRLLELELAKLCPARIRRALVVVLRAGFVEVRRADRAQPGAILAAEHLHRQRERERVARP
jgi:hypothetical protein